MAQEKPAQAESNGVGHNSNLSEDEKDELFGMFEEYADCDAVAKQNNAARKAIRERACERFGIDSQAFQHSYGYNKRNLRDREGYDDSVSICMDVLNRSETRDMFSFMQDDKPVADNTKAAA